MCARTALKYGLQWIKVNNLIFSKSKCTLSSFSYLNELSSPPINIGSGFTFVLIEKLLYCTLFINLFSSNLIMTVSPWSTRIFFFFPELWKPYTIYLFILILTMVSDKTSCHKNVQYIAEESHTCCFKSTPQWAY